MRNRLLLAIFTVGLLLLGGAGDPLMAGDDRKEITGFVGYRGGGEFQSFTTGRTFDVKSSEVYGLVFDFPISDEAKFEFLYSRQETDIETSGFFGSDTVPLELSYYHVGALYQPSDDEKMQPFVGGGLGATYGKANNPNGSSDTAFSFSFGGGVKFFFGDHVGIRLEGRIYTTLVNGGSSVFCGGGTGGGGCAFGWSGNALIQGEANAGITIAF